MRVCALLFAVLAALAPASLHAGDYKYPKAAPVLSLTLPADWEVVEQTGPAVLLLCTPPDEESYTVSVMTLPTVGNAEDLAATLGRITRVGAQGAGMTEVVVSKATEESIGGGPRRFTRVSATGKHNDEASAFTFYAFRLPSTGRTYAVGVAGAQAMIDAHRQDFEGIVRSLVPLNPAVALPVPATPGDGPTVETRPKP